MRCTRDKQEVEITEIEISGSDCTVVGFKKKICGGNPLLTLATSLNYESCLTTMFVAP